jgi:hypothetical protein
MRKCNESISEKCRECKDRVCSKVPMVQHILGSEDERKIGLLSKVMEKFGLMVKDYLQV